MEWMKWIPDWAVVSSNWMGEASNWNEQRRPATKKSRLERRLRPGRAAPQNNLGANLKEVTAAPPTFSRARSSSAGLQGLCFRERALDPDGSLRRFAARPDA